MNRFLLSSLLVATCWGQAVPVTPELPRGSLPPSTQPTVTGVTTNVPDTGNVSTNGTNLQSVYNAASCGDKITVTAGVEYRNSFVFNKQCNSSNWIQIVSTNLASIPITTYVTQGQVNNQNTAPSAPNTANFAKLTSGNGAQVFGCTSVSNVPAKFNYFAGIEVTNTVGAGLVLCTSGTETLASQVPDHVIFDRMFVHGITGSSTQMFTQGMQLAGSNIAAVNNYISDIYSIFFDNQAILLINGPGPYLIHNNFLEGASENILSGGGGKSPGIHCDTSASPASTTTTATVTNCLDALGGAATTPAVGTYVMFNTLSLVGVRIPAYLTCCGLDDLTAGGNYSGTDQRTQFYIVQTDGTGTPNTFRWLKNGVLQASTVPMTACPTTTTLTDSITVCWTSTTGHTITTGGNGWHVLATNGYTSDDYTLVTGNSSGALTFNAIPAAPIAGTATVQYGIIPSDITITQNVFFKPPSWNPAGTTYDGVGGNRCTVAASPAPTTTSATLTGCGSFPGVSASGVFTVSGATTQITLLTSNSGTGAVTFAAQSAAPTVGAGLAVFGPYRDVKNLLEAKYGQRWFVNGNIFQHMWDGGQAGFLNINASDQNGDCPWCVSLDLTITNNIWQDLAAGFTVITAQSYSGPAPGRAARIKFSNNLVWPQQTSFGLLYLNGLINIGGNPLPGVKNGPDSFQFIHNTLMGPGVNIRAGSPPAMAYTNFVYQDNLTEFDQYRWTNSFVSGPDGIPVINSTIDPDGSYSIDHNAIVNTGATNGVQGVSNATLQTRYCVTSCSGGALILNPVTANVITYTAAQFGSLTAYNSLAGINADYHNYALVSGSPFHNLASDGTDPGVNFTLLDAALAGGGVGSSGSVMSGSGSRSGKAVTH